MREAAMAAFAGKLAVRVKGMDRSLGVGGLDSERFRLAPRTCRCFRGSLSVR
jgi:hypothetical protein